jgi:hypothetical protein
MADHASKSWLKRELQEPVEEELAPKLAQVLANANLESVKARYPNDTEGNRPGPIGLESDLEYVLLCRQQARYRLHEVTPMQVIAGCHDLEYQSCEVEDWQSSRARLWLLEIVDTASRKLKVWSHEDTLPIRNPHPETRKGAPV